MGRHGLRVKGPRTSVSSDDAQDHAIPGGISGPLSDGCALSLFWDPILEADGSDTDLRYAEWVEVESH